MASPSTDSINVYTNVDGRLIASQEQTLAKLLFDLPSTQADGKAFGVQPGSGAMAFMDERIHDQRDPKTLPLSQDKARAAAEVFFRRVRQVSNNLPPVDGERLPPLLPSDLRLASMTAVFAREGGVSHVLCRYVPFLATGISVPVKPTPPKPDVIEKPSIDSSPSLPGAMESEGTAPVYPGAIDVRLGAQGEVVGLCSRWRPTVSSQIVRRLPAPSSQAALVYRAAPIDEVQPLLTPFYLTPNPDGDSLGFIPASVLSMSVSIVVDYTASEVVAQVVVDGAAGPLNYQWAFWRLTTPIDEAPTLSEGGPQIRLPNGAYNLIVDVEDRSTGNCVRGQALAYAPGAAS